MCREINHAAIWSAIDAIALGRGMSLSALSVQATGQKTTFATPHRVENGKLRWPSTQTVCRLLDAIGMSFGEFGDLVEAQRRKIERGMLPTDVSVIGTVARRRMPIAGPTLAAECGVGSSALPAGAEPSEAVPARNSGVAA